MPTFPLRYSHIPFSLPKPTNQPYKFLNIVLELLFQKKRQEKVEKLLPGDRPNNKLYKAGNYLKLMVNPTSNPKALELTPEEQEAEVEKRAKELEEEETE